jgi:hypothetical protein
LVKNLDNQTDSIPSNPSHTETESEDFKFFWKVGDPEWGFHLGITIFYSLKLVKEWMPLNFMSYVIQVWIVRILFAYKQTVFPFNQSIPSTRGNFI